VLLEPVDLSDASDLTMLVYVVAAIELLYLVFWMGRAATAGVGFWSSFPGRTTNGGG
jgi:hypothetical protein